MVLNDMFLNVQEDEDDIKLYDATDIPPWIEWSAEEVHTFNVMQLW